MLTLTADPSLGTEFKVFLKLCFARVLGNPIIHLIWWSSSHYVLILIEICQHLISVVFKLILNCHVHNLYACSVCRIHIVDWLEVHDPVGEAVDLEHEILQLLLLTLLCRMNLTCLEVHHFNKEN